MFKYKVVYTIKYCGMLETSTKFICDSVWFKRIVSELGTSIVEICIDNVCVWNAEENDYALLKDIA